MLIYERIREIARPQRDFGHRRRVQARASTIRIPTSPSSPPLYCFISVPGGARSAVTLGIGIITTVFTGTLTRLIVATWVVEGPQSVPIREWAFSDPLIHGLGSDCRSDGRRSSICCRRRASCRTTRISILPFPSHQPDFRFPRRDHSFLHPWAEFRYRLRGRHVDSAK